MAAFVPSAGIYSENKSAGGHQLPIQWQRSVGGHVLKGPTFFSAVTIHIPQVSPPLFDAVRDLF
jgi:hypothetical protein